MATSSRRRPGGPTRAGRVSVVRVGAFLVVAALMGTGCGDEAAPPTPSEPAPIVVTEAAPTPSLTPVEPTPTPTPSPTPTSPPPVQVASRADLELIDPWSITPGAPEDDGSGEMESIVHLGPSGAVVHAAPGRDVIGLLPGITLMDDTAIPVTDRDGDWLRVMLPSRLSLPSQGGAVNGATGWIHVSDVAELTPSTHSVVVDLVAHTVTVHGPDGTVTVPTRHGAPESPTPQGRTYLASRWTEESSTPAVAALGAHSPTLDAFGDGPAVVAIHSYTGETTQGVGSNGCIRLHPDDWIRSGLADLPIGTPVSVVSTT